MSSRQEEKEARRKERMEQEARERKAAGRIKRLQYVVGGVLAAGIVVALVVVFALGGDGDSGSAGSDSSNPSADVTLPEPAILDEAQAVEAAGCELTVVENEGRGHEEKDFTAADYDSNPPTSGTHFPTWAEDGIYEPGQTPSLGELVHTLEHGRINVQYKPGTDAQMVAQLEAFLAENDGYHMVMYENTTEMQAQVTATAWDHKLECPSPSPEMWDALRTFRDAHIDRAPEKVA